MNGLCLPALLSALDDPVLQQALSLSLDGRSLSGVDASLFCLEADDATLVGVDLDVGSTLSGSGGTCGHFGDVAVLGNFVNLEHGFTSFLSLCHSFWDGWVVFPSLVRSVLIEERLAR